MKTIYLPFILTGLIVATVATIANAQPVAQPPETEAGAEIPKDQDKKALIRYSGVVQYADGSLERVDASKAKAPVAFGLTIYEDDRLQLGADSTLKIVTRQECIAVFHGEGVALASNREKPWRLKTNAVRWICPEGKIDTFQFQNFRYRITGGEVLIAGDKLILLSGELRATKTPEGGFTARTLYVLTNGTYSKVEPQDERAAWTFNQSRKPPKESTKWVEPKLPEVPPATKEQKKSRLLFTPVFGGAYLGYDVSSLNENEAKSEGGRIQYMRRLESGRSFLASISVRGVNPQDDTGGGSGSGSGPSPKTVSNDAFLMLLEGGWRDRHDSVFSSYLRLGAGYAKSRISVNRQDVNYRSETTYEFGVISAAGGVDVIYCPSIFDTLGLTAGIEAQGIQSLSRLGRESNANFSNTGSPPEAKEPSSLSMFGINIMLGLVYQF